MKFYVDTSVWGGYYDKEFSSWTIPFIEQAREGRFIIIISDVTIGELQFAPLKVRNLLETIPIDFIELINISQEQLELAEKYVEEGALTPKFLSDAQHIAISSILKVDSLVSWNFKHIVNYKLIRLYNSVNLKFGYPVLEIRTPRETIEPTQ